MPFVRTLKAHWMSVAKSMAGFSWAMLLLVAGLAQSAATTPGASEDSTPLAPARVNRKKPRVVSHRRRSFLSAQPALAGEKFVSAEARIRSVGIGVHAFRSKSRAEGN